MDKDILSTYLNIARTRSLSKTAEQIFISQSAVSNRLIRLEKELNTRLIERNPGQREIVLTQKGREFVEIAKHYLELEQQIADWGNSNTAEILRVSSVISLTDHIFKSFFRQILEQENISIVLSTHWTDRINGCGMTKYVLFQGLVAAFLVRTPVAYYFSHLPSPSLFYILLGSPIATAVQILMHLIALYCQTRSIKEKHLSL